MPSNDLIDNLAGVLYSRIGIITGHQAVSMVKAPKNGGFYQRVSETQTN